MEISPEVLAAFEKQFGRLPSTADLFLLREAAASVALDKGDDGQTFSVEGAYTMTPEQAEAARTNHEYCGRLDCPVEEHADLARREHALRMEGVKLAVDLIREHARTGASMHPCDEFRDGCETAANVAELALYDPLFVPPLYDECTDTPTLLEIKSHVDATSGGDGDR